MKVTVIVSMEIDDSAIESVKKIEHHAESLLDLDSWPEIKSVFGVKVAKNTGEITRYVGECKNIKTGEYGAPFVTEISPVLAHNRAIEAAKAENINAGHKEFDTADVRVTKIVDTIVCGGREALSDDEQQMVDSFAEKHRGKLNPLTKNELRAELASGKTLDDILSFTSGQECMIFKADQFALGDTVLYIPDIHLNEIPTDRILTAEEIDDVLDLCYTGNEFLEIAEGDVTDAVRLFFYCDWQHPGSAWDAGELADDEEEG